MTYDKYEKCWKCGEMTSRLSDDRSCEHCGAVPGGQSSTAEVGKNSGVTFRREVSTGHPSMFGPPLGLREEWPSGATKTVWKHKLRHGVTTIPLPFDSKVVLVGPDPQRTPCAWIEVNGLQQVEEHEILVYGTGFAMPGNVKHVGSFIDGMFVWHVYMRRVNG